METIILTVFFSVAILAFIVATIIYKRRGASTSSVNYSKAKESDKVKTYDASDLFTSINDIVDGIVVTNDYYRFVAAISCTGVNFYQLTAAEQLGIANGYQTFIASIPSMMTYRAFSKSIDISSVVDRYEKRRGELVEQFEYLTQYRSGLDEKADIEEITATEQAIKTLDFQISHMDIQLQAMEYYSSADVVQDVTQTYVFEWFYSPSNYTVKHNREERLAIAKNELALLANKYMDALRSAKVRAHVCDQDEMIDMFRRVSQPISSEQQSAKRIYGSSFFDDIVTSGTVKSETLNGNGGPDNV